MSSSNESREGLTPLVKSKARAWQTGFAALLMLSCAPAALHAETSNEELAQEIKALRAQIREMKSSIAETRVETRRTSAKVKLVASHGPYEPAAPTMAIPAGATPLFVTADKKMQFGAITITPGGYFAGESVYRSKATGSDIGTSFGNIPFKNSTLGNVGEFRPSARSTRLALLAEGAITPTMIAGAYAEVDFFSAAQTANYNQTNSYNPRIRHLYMTLDSGDYGMHVLAGQTYSLLTLSTKGITPRNELTPSVIDNNQTVGSIYARQPQIRLVKDFNQKLWLAVSAEASETTNNCTGAAVGGANGATGTFAAQPIPTNNGSTLGAFCNYTGAGGDANTLNQSFNHIPDVVAKAAYEARIADRDVHFEGFGIYTDLYDRTQTQAAGATVPTFANHDTTGYGVGGGIVAAVIPKRLDFQVNGIYGRGIGRYGPTGITESTFNPDGSERALPEVMGLAGFTFHATPSFDVYGYAGVESAVRSYSAFNANPTYIGVGAPTIDDTGCNLTSGAAAAAAGVTGGCTGSTKLAYELTVGIWDKIYKGPFGEVRGGLQYAYVQRQLFNAPGLPAVKTDENMVFTSLRYYPFQ